MTFPTSDIPRSSCLLRDVSVHVHSLVDDLVCSCVGVRQETALLVNLRENESGTLLSQAAWGHTLTRRLWWTPSIPDGQMFPGDLISGLNQCAPP